MTYSRAKKTLISMIILGGLTSSFAYAADTTTPKFDCTLTDQMSADKQPGDDKDSFAKTTPMIYLVCTTEDVSKGQVLKADWVAIDTKNVAPPNYQIASKSIPIEKNLADDQDYTANFSLSKPNNGWPVGSYSINISLDDQKVKEIKFSVE